MRIIENGKTAQEIYEELKTQGVEVVIHNGIYCKVVSGTFEAINPIPPIIEYTPEELAEMEEME